MRPASIITLRQTATLVIVVALIITMLPLLVQGFMPTQSATEWTHSEGSSTHESITFDAIEDYDKDIFGLRARSKPLTQTMKDARQEIIDANASVDDRGGSQFLQSAAHFDGEAFQQSQQRLIDFKLKVKELVDPPVPLLPVFKPKPDFNKARRVLGQALHTLQDFYSHRNWVELGNTSPYAILGVPGNPLIDPLPTMNTCTDCTRNFCTDCYNPATNLTNLTGSTLTSGYYLYEECILGSCSTTPEDHLKPNDLKCSHGGKVTVGPLNVASGRDVSGKGTISSGINKDTKVCKISPHNDKHVAAAEMAKKATKLYLDDLKKRLGIRKMRVLLGGGPTLAMSIDTTGSMAFAIAEVKEQVIQMVDSRLNTDDEASQYILVPFNDPNIGPVTVTDDPTEFKEAVRALSASGGGDCPEFSNTGMLQALDNMDEGDELFLFTDASSKDRELAGAVEGEALSKGIRISPITFGSCSPIDPAYVRVAGDTGGQLFQLGREEAGNIARLADFLVRSNSVDLLHINDTLTDSKNYLVPVDSTITRVIFSVSAAASVVVTRPDGTDVQPWDPDVQNVSLSTGSIYSISNPARGSWTVRIQGAGDFSLRVTGESSLDFSYFRFVRPSDAAPHPGFFPRVGFPQVNETATIESQLSAEAATVNLDLRTPSGATLQQVSATEIGWANDNPSEESFTIGPVRRFIADISTPATPFRAYATGHDANGFLYQRVISGTTRPQSIKVTAPPPQDLVPGQTTAYSFAVTNLGSPDTFDIRGVDDNGFLTGISPTTVTLGTNETQNVVASLTAPVEASYRALDTLTVTAQSAGTFEAFNYARVQSVVTSNVNLAVDSFNVTEVGGNNNAIIEAGENGLISVHLVNIGNTTVTGIQAALTTAAHGVTVHNGSSTVPDIIPSDLGANTTPFTFSLASEVTFGLSVDFTLTVTYAGAVQPLTVKLSVPIGGVAPRPLDQIVFTTFRDGNREIYGTNATGSELVNLTKNPAEDFSAVPSPDSSKIAFMSNRSGSLRLYVMNSNGSNPMPLSEETNDLPDNGKISWSPDGSKIAFVRYVDFTRQISVVNVDGSNGGVLTSNTEDSNSPTWSPDGTKIAFTRGSFFSRNLNVIDVGGSNQIALTTGRDISEPAWSPDGSWIAFILRGPRSFYIEGDTLELAVINPNGSDFRQLTTTTRSQNPKWSPNGTKIAFASYRPTNGNFDIYVMNADGSAELNVTNDQSDFFFGFPPSDLEPAWSPDGSQIVYTRFGTDIGVASADGTNKLLVHEGQFTVLSPLWLRPTLSLAPPGKGDTTTSISSDKTNSGYGEPLTFKAIVSSASGTPSGSVQFFDGSVLLGNVPLNNGVALLSSTNLSLGPHSLKAVYAETDNFLPSESPTLTALIFAYISAGNKSFVVGDVNAQVGNSITFWDSQWANLNELSDGPVSSAFKGFASSTNTSPMRCGGAWSSSGGNSSIPPNSVPSYMAVIVSSLIVKSGSIISGNIPRVVIVKTALGYDGSPGHAGAGVIVGTLCQQ